MKLVAQNYRSGELSVLDVPRPVCRPGGVLVRSRYSLISTGTEMMKVGEARMSLLGKARARPDQLRKVIATVNQLGPAAAYSKVMTRLDSYTPLGYSLCGVVEDVGAGADEFAVGQLVACAGNEFALHAEINWVPINLCVAVPDGVAPDAAAFATVGAIAMHGVRRAEVQLGESACVIGLGIVGQLVARLLVASGVQVFGLDMVADRCRLAEKAGALACSSPEAVAELEQQIAEATRGLGVDHVLLAAGGSSNEPVDLAARLARDRARVVVIGKSRLDLPWNDYYEKELEVRFSRSYGPGRYDHRYEIDGVDYPPGYVRWTERRNLASFLDQISSGALDVSPLVSEIFPVDDAVAVYERLHAGRLRGVGFLFRYPEGREEARPLEHGRVRKDAKSVTTARAPRQLGGRTVRVGFVGAGNYASSMLLPHLAGNEAVELVHVATRSSLSAVNAQRRFGFRHASTDVDSVLDDDTIDAVFVVTHHHSHAALASRALEGGKAVFVEKPLALSAQELVRVLDAVEASGNDRLMVGFNRRFAPLLSDLKTRYGTSRVRSVARYSVNAGQLDAGSWYADAGREGSRFVGEGGHFIDTLSWWLDARPIEVHAIGTGPPGDLHVAIRFDDGSIGTVTYVTHGSPRFPKETFEAAAGGRTAKLDNFRRAALWEGRRRWTKRAWGAIDKGQRHEVERFVDAVRRDRSMPISLASIADTTRATLAVDRSLASAAPERL